ncbi:hypothetical protein niasHS_004502 [Heterodera schachtii]|uniref:Uncharacterized protein n=1 Tax=Heterodera schachtii TaxID=97005 RepID=A0ABD2JMF1_HETSC
MEAIYEKCIEIASEKKAELCELDKEINELVLNIWKHRTKEKKKEMRKEKRRKYEEKFELMIDSPFTNKLFDLEEQLRAPRDQSHSV